VNKVRKWTTPEDVYKRELLTDYCGYELDSYATVVLIHDVRSKLHASWFCNTSMFLQLKM